VVAQFELKGVSHSHRGFSPVLRTSVRTVNRFNGLLRLAIANLGESISFAHS
jgi:hypothetical protein